MSIALKKFLKDNRVCVAMAALGAAPLACLFLRGLWQRPAYRFFPLALAAAVILAWRAARKIGAGPLAGAARAGGALSGVAILVFLAANALWSPWLGAVALLLALAAAAGWIGGGGVLKLFLPSLLMAACIIPPPLGWDHELTVWLGTVAVQASSCLLDFLKVVHTLEGNTILLPGKSLLVAEACSGINSVVLCGAICLFYALWRRRPLRWLLWLLPITCLFVLLGNSIRITTGAALYYYRGIDWLSGFPHEVFGLALLLGYVILIVSLDQLFLFLSPPPGGEAAAVSAEKSTPPSRAPGLARKAAWLIGTVGLAVFAARLVLGGVQVAALVPNLGRPRDLQLSLPPGVAGWRQVKAAPDTALAETLGVRSILWRFARDGADAVVAVDYPLEGFHNASSCYRNNGWLIASEEPAGLTDGGAAIPALKETMQRSACQHAILFHAVLNERGEWLLPPARKSTFAIRLQGDDPAALQTSYRIQCLTGAYAPVPPELADSVRELFFQSGRLLRRQLISQCSKARGPWISPFTKSTTGSPSVRGVHSGGRFPPCWPGFLSLALLAAIAAKPSGTMNLRQEYRRIAVASIGAGDYEKARVACLRGLSMAGNDRANLEWLFNLSAALHGLGHQSEAAALLAAARAA